MYRFRVRVEELGRQHKPAEKSLAAYSSICLPAKFPPVKANCHWNPKGKSVLQPSGQISENRSSRAELSAIRKASLYQTPNAPWLWQVGLLGGQWGQRRGGCATEHQRRQKFSNVNCCLNTRSLSKWKTVSVLLKQVWFNLSEMSDNAIFYYLTSCD